MDDADGSVGEPGTGMDSVSVLALVLGDGEVAGGLEGETGTELETTEDGAGKVRPDLPPRGAGTVRGVRLALVDGEPGGLSTTMSSSHDVVPATWLSAVWGVWGVWGVPDEAVSEPGPVPVTMPGASPPVPGWMAIRPLMDGDPLADDDPLADGDPLADDEAAWLFLNWSWISLSDSPFGTTATTGPAGASGERVTNQTPQASTGTASVTARIRRPRAACRRRSSSRRFRRRPMPRAGASPEGRRDHQRLTRRSIHRYNWSTWIVRRANPRGRWARRGLPKGGSATVSQFLSGMGPARSMATLLPCNLSGRPHKTLRPG